MNMTASGGRAAHPLVWLLAVFIAMAVLLSAYLVLGPKATDFAGGKRVALGEYHEKDPTGVPAELQVRESHRARRIFDAGGGLHGLPYRQRRGAVRRRARICAAIRNALFDEHHTRCGDGHRRVLGSEFLGRRAQGHRPWQYQALPRHAVSKLHLHDGCRMRSRSKRTCSRSNHCMHPRRTTRWHSRSISAAS